MHRHRPPHLLTLGATALALLCLASCGGAALGQPASRAPSAAALVSTSSDVPSPGGAPLRDGLSAPPRTRLVAPVGFTGSGTDTAWYGVLVVDEGLDPREPLAALAAQAQQAGYGRQHQTPTTEELAGVAAGNLVRTLQLGAVPAHDAVPAYLQVIMTSSPKTAP